MLLLPDAVTAMHGLFFHLGVPPRIEDDDVVRRRQIEADAHRHLTRQQNLDVLLVRERMDQTVSRPEVDLPVDADEIARGEVLFDGDGDDVEERCELGEDDDLLVEFLLVFDHVANGIDEHVHFRRGDPRALAEPGDMLA